MDCGGACKDEPPAKRCQQCGGPAEDAEAVAEAVANLSLMGLPTDTVSQNALEVHARVDEMINVLMPNHTTEQQRLFVFDYVGRLLSSVIPDIKIFPFGSNPLKTYLPDGDVDICVVSADENWFIKARDILSRESRNPTAKIDITNVIFIPAKVKIIKCLIGNIAIDISSNTVGGLGSLCFIEEVDRLFGRDHLVKKSIMLVKAWSYYESRILGSHNGLMSTYALEVLVLYIINMHHNEIRKPLQALFLFLQFYSTFDWDRYCITVLGPVRMEPETGLRESVRSVVERSQTLPMSYAYLTESQAKYSGVPPGAAGDRAKVFDVKHVNIMDPLHDDNNLGRSVSQGNTYRIRRAFAHGARDIRRYLGADVQSTAGVDRFFRFVWARHEGGVRPDLHVRGERRLSATGGRRLSVDSQADAPPMRHSVGHPLPEDTEDLLYDIDEQSEELDTHFVFCERGGDMLAGRLDQMRVNYKKAQGLREGASSVGDGAEAAAAPAMNVTMSRPPWVQKNSDHNLGRLYCDLPGSAAAGSGPLPGAGPDAPANGFAKRDVNREGNWRRVSNDRKPDTERPSPAKPRWSRTDGKPTAPAAQAARPQPVAAKPPSEVPPSGAAAGSGDDGADAAGTTPAHCRGADGKGGSGDGLLGPAAYSPHEVRSS